MLFFWLQWFLEVQIQPSDEEKNSGRKLVQEVPIISKCKERNRVKTKNREMPLISNFVSYLFLN
ncbi:hypothetical protein BACEGG_01208 [Bacteroides eggerthii DSM 20697]|uniref:Uncharacterized protein n=1 Tax=Bacteroides fragilis 3_1_12 TaxID=457424 RepID=A0ABN0BJ10_BACFG|nr:hypothetical protein BACEGG_01208 [Bacteroides eggerthii DSM 20697]EFR52893.1 hypothetical protein BFAG_01588 [Bacteroides fragilis 3_1_12]DAG29503.1 MAG TPA: hypothetical protein [Caudoviricetes sp.]